MWQSSLCCKVKLTCNVLQAAEEVGGDEEEAMGMASMPPVMVTPSSIGSVLRPDLAPQARS